MQNDTQHSLQTYLQKVDCCTYGNDYLLHFARLKLVKFSTTKYFIK